MSLASIGCVDYKNSETITLQPRNNAPRYSTVLVIMLTHDGPQLLAIKMHYN